MKQAFIILSLCLVWLFTNCAPKQLFLYSNFPADHGVKPKVKPEILAVPNTETLSKKQVVISKNSPADSDILTVSLSSLPLVKEVIIPKKVLLVNSEAAPPNKIPVNKLALNPAKILKLKKVMHRQLKAWPDDGSRPTNKLAKAGFYLGLTTLGLLILAGITSSGGLFMLTMLTGIASFISDLVGLNQIKRNPDQYVGKGKAIFGLVTGVVILLVLLFFTLYILAFAGAFV